MSAALLSSSSQQPFSAAFLSNLSQWSGVGSPPILNFLSSSSQQIFSKALFSRSSQYLFSATILSSLFQQLLSTIILLWSGVNGPINIIFRSLFQQLSYFGLFSAAFVSSSSQKIFSAALLSSYSQQPFSTILFTYYLAVVRGSWSVCNIIFNNSCQLLSCCAQELVIKYITICLKRVFSQYFRQNTNSNKYPSPNNSRILIL